MKAGQLGLSLCLTAFTGCAERVTAPEVAEFISRWDSGSMKLSEDGLAMTWAPVNSFANLPSGFSLAVNLDGHSEEYRAVVLESQRKHSRYEAAGCPTGGYVTVLLWREATL